MRLTKRKKNRIKQETDEMRVYCIDHFFDREKALSRFDQIKQKYNLPEPQEDEEYLKKIITSSMRLGLKSDNYITTLEFYLDNGEIKPGDFFTIIYEDNGEPSLKIDQFMPNIMHLTHQLTPVGLDELYNYLSRISLSTFLINHAYGVVRDDYQKLTDAEKNLIESVLQQEKGADHLKEIETDLQNIERILESMGTRFTRIHEYYLFADLHYKNLVYDTTDLDKKYRFSIDIRPVYVKIQEMKNKYEQANIRYTKWRDEKDILLGYVQYENLKESLKLRKHSLTIEQAAIAIEAFIVYVYTFHIWDLVNPDGFSSASTSMKFIIPLLVALGAVFLVESLKNIYLYWNEVSQNRETLTRIVVFCLLSVSLLSVGLAYMTGIISI
jgi:hypothetical protein